jgi:hypothetical protein
MEASRREEKPKRLYFKTYLQMIRNSVGTEMFRNFYIQSGDGKEVDAVSDGSNSCAFYVSGVLTLMKKHSGVHGTVESTIADLVRCGWQPVTDAKLMPGDVIVWERIKVEDDWFQHIGFYIGDGRAVSTSQTEKKVVEHDAHFDGARSIEQIFRHNIWD